MKGDDMIVAEIHATRQKLWAERKGLSFEKRAEQTNHNATVAETTFKRLKNA